MRTPDLNASPLVDLARRIQRLERQAALGFSSITRGGLRIASEEGLVVEGSEKITGTLFGDGSIEWTGTARFSSPGTLEAGDSTFEDVSVTETLDVTAEATFQSSVEIQDTLDVTAATRLRGVTDMENDLNVINAGRVIIGNVTLDPGGAYGGRITAGGVGILYLDAVNVLAREYISADGLSIGALGATVLGDFTVFGAKSFGIEHPSKPGVLLRHSATESPVSGTEYVGSDVFDDDGQRLITLPDYFESLNKPDDRFVFIAPMGRPFATGADPVEDGAFTAYGEPGRSFSWLVKAERIGGDFEVESPMPDQPVQESNSGQ